MSPIQSGKTCQPDKTKGPFFRSRFSGLRGAKTPIRSTKPRSYKRIWRVRNSALLARKKERSGPIAYQSVLHLKKLDLLLRGRTRLGCRSRRSLRSSGFPAGLPRFLTALPALLTPGPTRFYPGPTTGLLLWGRRGGGSLGSRSLLWTRGWSRISCENAGFSDKADDHS